MYYRSLYFLLVSLLLCACHNSGKPEKTAFERTRDSLTTDLKEISKNNDLAGFGVAIFHRDSVLYKNGFGYANKEQQTPYTVTSNQLIASISKTFIGVSLMIAVENGWMKLDDDVNDHVDFNVQNPRHPDAPITLKQLASHTSSIGSPNSYNKTYLFSAPLQKERWPEAWHPYVDIYNKNEEASLASFLRNTLTEEGDWFQEDSFLADPPGSTYDYSNLGSSLLALAIENAAGQSYASFVKEHIFKPLEMKSTAWDLNELNPRSHVTYYIENGNQIPPYRLITYPDGGIVSTIEDMILYGQELLKCADGNGRLLSKESFEVMTQSLGDELPDAIGWDLSFAPLIGHAGNEFGSSTLFYFNPQSKTGQLLFSNSSIGNEAQEETFYGIFNTLFQYDLSEIP